MFKYAQHRQTASLRFTAVCVGGFTACKYLPQVSEVLEQWIALQRQWMYLEPIFSSQDIMQQLPLEGAACFQQPALFC